MGVYDLPEYFRIARDPAPYCEIQPILQVSRSVRDGSIQTVRRGPLYVWSQQFSAYVHGGYVGKASAFLSRLEPPLNALRCTDFVHVADYGLGGVLADTDYSDYSPLSDGAKFIDGAEISNIHVSVAAAANENATSVSMTANKAILLREGRRIQIGRHLYKVLSDAALGESSVPVDIYPPAREKINANAPVIIDSPKGLWAAQIEPADWLTNGVRRYAFSLTEYFGNPDQ